MLCSLWYSSFSQFQCLVPAGLHQVSHRETHPTLTCRYEKLSHLLRSNLSYTFCFRDSIASFQEARENLDEAKKQARKDSTSNYLTLSDTSFSFMGTHEANSSKGRLQLPELDILSLAPGSITYQLSTLIMGVVCWYI